MTGIRAICFDLYDADDELTDTFLNMALVKMNPLKQVSFVRWHPQTGNISVCPAAGL